MTGSSDSSGLFGEQRRIVRHIVGSPKFDACMGFIILSNCVSIGVEQTYDIQGSDTTAIKILEHVYLCLYLVELLCRFFAWRWICLDDNWVRFDTFLVVVGILTNWVLTPVLG